MRMGEVSSLRVGRFMRLPRRSDERWQGGVVRLPSWVDEPDGPFRPWAAVWVSRSTGRVHMELERGRDAHDWTLALEALIEFGLKRGLVECRPAVLEVADEALGHRVREALGEGALEIESAPGLPAVQEVLALMSEHAEGRPMPAGALDGTGVTVDRMRAFAAAARRFWEAAPWRNLGDEDLVEVEGPAAGRGLAHVSVLGAAGQTFGLAFFDSVKDHQALQEGRAPGAIGRPRWSVLFGPITGLPFGDADLWEDHRLPVAGDDAYPLASRFGGAELRRPDARTLAYLEGLLGAFAVTTEDEIDAGRWTREVETREGTVLYRLAIPALLEPLDAPAPARPGGFPDRRAMERFTAEIGRFLAGSEFESVEDANRAIAERFRGPLDAMPSTASSPLEQAQDLAYRAFEARGRRRIQLARKALELSRDCADAWVILGENAPDLERARELYAEGVSAGERALGPQVFEQEAGHFWGPVETRPYMRARFGLAQVLDRLGRRDEAMEHYRELLRLNTNDNQGVRDLVLPALLVAGRDDEAAALLDRYADDAAAVWRYGHALVTFRREGDSAAARDRLREALRANRRLAKYLADAASLPDQDPETYAFGSEEEAVIAARMLAEAWSVTPGAGAWLAAAGGGGRSGPKKRRR
jgi:tetratricopeptide (TPR) repeat protein